MRLCDPFHATSLSVRVPKDSPSQEAAETLSYSPRRKSLESLTPFCPGQNVRFTCARNRFANIFPPLDFLLSIVVSIMMKRNRKGAASRLRAVTAHGTYRRPAPCVPSLPPTSAAAGLIHPRLQFCKPSYRKFNNVSGLILLV